MTTCWRRGGRNRDSLLRVNRAQTLGRGETGADRTSFLWAAQDNRLSCTISRKSETQGTQSGVITQQANVKVTLSLHRRSKSVHFTEKTHHSNTASGKQLNMSTLNTLLVTVIFTFKLASIAAAKGITETETIQKFGECTGSLVVLTSAGEEKKFPATKRKTALDAVTVQAEGCGCYYVYKRTNLKSTSEFISPSMGSLSGDTIGFKIRSIERVSCEATAQPTWVVVCIVAGLVLTVAIMAILGIKCYRKYNRVPTEERPNA